MNNSNDFDFIVGKWTVLNRRLINRLSNSNEWVEFNAEYESWHVLNGMGNMDEIKVENELNNTYGLSMRIYNPENNEWKIYWADNHHPEKGLTLQVCGKFEGKLGTFYGDEFFEGKFVKLRFIWESKSEDHAYWEQAYFDEKS